DAPGALVQALETAARRAEVDTLLLVRGGGSLEDLWAFNDEALAYAIAASPIPVVSGVGHETDFTIADFVADVRAPTPTAAAELSCMPQDDCLRAVNVAFNALTQRQLRLIERASLRLDRARAALVSPRQRLQRQSERLAALTLRLERAAGRTLERTQARHTMVGARLQRCLPKLDTARSRVVTSCVALDRVALSGLAQRREALASLAKMLEALGPRSVLERGYSITRDAQGNIIKNGLDLNVGETLHIELGRGSAQATVVARHGLL